MKDIAFIDLEASGLGARSWPIEVGWCFRTGAAQSVLIKPEENWPLDQWDESAFSLHGIPLERLMSSGVASSEVCKTLNDVLGGLKVYSDAADWDGFWLYRLFQAGRIRQQFELIDFSTVVSAIDQNRMHALEVRASEIAPRVHRAAQDAAHMQVLYSLAAQND